MTTTIKAAANPALANQIFNNAITEEPKEVLPEITVPSDTAVTLPGGYINAAGEVITDVEIRELNGRDEEAISKAQTLGRALLTILNRGTVKVGSEPATEQLLDQLLIGDRDAILIGIAKATFGKDIDIQAYCTGCSEVKTVKIDLDEDIKIKTLSDPMNDRVISVKGKTNEYVLQLPNGIVQKKMIDQMDKTGAELSTLLLEGTLVSINGSPVISKTQAQTLSVSDRKALITALNTTAAGPQFDDLSVTCPDCESEVSVPISLGSLFQF